MRVAALGFWLALVACSSPEDVPSAGGTSVAVAPLPRPRPASAAFDGDPADSELQVLDLSRAELDADFVLGLPGSEGMPLDGRAAGVLVVHDFGRSIGTPQSGSLQRGIQLPFDPGLYTRRDASRSFGSTHTIRTIQTALRTMRDERNFHSAVIIGDISRRRGGPFSPHVSHQNGRDIDIRLVVAPGLDRETLPRAAHLVDWDAMWGLVHSFLETGQVTHVFLSFQRQRDLYEAGRRAGVHDRVLDKWFQWPNAGGPYAIISHEDGHLAHLHIRLKCGPDDSRCR